ncbi:MAG: phosphomannomutase/phosphoglucomutase [Synergistaceae bacterium]|jgi:phosphomannomutase/phosphoglucomutase|nr:phosphomannomutase/phosphoglucomutase [Synergistaceae bacterium]
MEGETLRVPEHIFREYDIRGVADTELTSETASAVGQAFGTYLSDLGIYTVTVGGDARLSTPRVKDSVITGLTRAGVSVIDIGLTATPVFYWSLYHFGVDGGVMVTGSHNPPEFNGLKLARGKATIWGDEIQEISRIINEGRMETASTPGHIRTADIGQSYLEMLISKIHLGPKKLKVAVDSGNGTGGLFAPDFLRALGCEVVELFSEPDGRFPNHHPDPTKREYVHTLIKAVLDSGADVGIGFDGDSDRIGVVDDKGNMLFGDQLMLLYWKEILPANPGAKVIVEVKSSMAVQEETAKLGGRPMWWKSGHSLVKAKMRDEGALFSGEVSGHMFFADEYWGFDDAFYAAGRLLRILSNTDKKLSGMIAEMPSYPSTAETRFSCADDIKFGVVERVRDGARGLDVIDVDGVRIIHRNGWSLLRASNTQPVLVARCEGRTADDLKEISDDMKRRIKEAGGPDFEWEY